MLIVEGEIWIPDSFFKVEIRASCATDHTIPGIPTGEGNYGHLTRYPCICHSDIKKVKDT